MLCATSRQDILPGEYGRQSVGTSESSFYVSLCRFRLGLSRLTAAILFDVDTLFRQSRNWR